MKTTVRHSERLDEQIHEAVLEDGLRVRFVPKPGYQKKFAILTTNYGSIDTAFVPPGGSEALPTPEGVAHFLEHKLFEDEAGDVFNLFARYGASANAYTSYSETAYHFTTSEHYYECLDLLLDFVAAPYFTEEQIEKERAVIAQEIRMYQDSPDSEAHLNLMRALYHAHPIREDITGTVASIARIDKPLLELCHGAFYRPENMLLVLAGDLDPAEAFGRAAENAARRAAKSTSGAAPSSGGPGGVRRAPIDEPPTIHQARIEKQMAVSLPQLLIGGKDVALPPGPDMVRHQREAGFVLELLFGRASAFFETHCASGLIDDTFSSSYTTGRGGYAHWMIGGETPDPDGLVAAVAETIERAAPDRLLDAAAFLRLRNKAYGRFLRSFNSLEAVACGEADATLEGWDLFGYLDILESITLERLEARLASLFDPSRRAISIVSPL